MYVKPQLGRQVPDPERGGLLPAEGRTVEMNQYWMRRINDGDIVEAPAPDFSDAIAPANADAHAIKAATPATPAAQASTHEDN